MTAIGATPEGIDEDEVARRVELLAADPALVAQYAATVRRWIVGPFHGGPADAIEVRIRAVALLDLASHGDARPMPGAVAVEPPAPGSVSDPAYSSPTPVAGDRLDPRDVQLRHDPGEIVERESPAGTANPAEVHDERVADALDTEDEQP